MNPILEWLNGAALSWWVYFLHASWQAALVGVVVLGVVNLVGQRWPAPLRYAFLVVALLKFACPPLLPFPTGVFSQFTFAKFSLPTGQERKPAQAASAPAAVEVAAVGAGGLEPIHWARWFMAVHLAGSATVALLIFRRAARLRRLAQACRSRLSSGLREQYRDLAIQMGVYRIPPLGISDRVEAPMAFSVPKPAIMLPTKIVGSLSPGELRAVLAHELAHCWRGDLWLAWVQLILLAVWWFHPIVWVVNRSLRDVREDCCDDLLLARRIVSNDAYCDVLLRAASHLCPSLPLSASLGLTGRLHPLGRRMARIADWTLRRRESVSAPGAFVVLLAAALVLPGTRPGETSQTVGLGTVMPLALEPKVQPGSMAPAPVSVRPPVDRLPLAWNASAQGMRASAPPNARSGNGVPALRSGGAGGSPAQNVPVTAAITRGPNTEANGAGLTGGSLAGRAQARAGKVNLNPALTRPATPGILMSTAPGTTVQVVYVQQFPARANRPHPGPGVRPGW